MVTHTVFNQSKPLVDYNMLSSDPLLNELVARYGAEWANDRLNAFGAFAGSSQAIEWAVQANENDPVLKTHDRFGNRIDRVDFHPAYHHIMGASIEHGIHSLPWLESRDGAHVARAALLFMAFQYEAGHCCPISMTYSVVPALRRQADLKAVFEPLITSNRYDNRFIPYFQKNGITVGMGMTEKQGGSDVRANTTRATPVGERGGGKAYLLTGHKWFCSAPMSDAFLVLAQTEKGPSCFLVPRFKPDGALNAIFIQRLKDKLGNRSNASGEIELADAFGWLVGDEGRGVPTIIEMVNHTRLDCTISSAALMRQATVQAVHHATYRKAFGKRLIEQPLMLNVLSDLSIEAEAALRLTMRVASSYDRAGTVSGEALFRRLGSAIAKYWVCKRVPAHVAEALECLGGNGYVEESPMPRLFRESPLLGIWEGSGNVICLDVLRAIAKEPETLDAVVSEIDEAKGAYRALDRHSKAIRRDLLSLKKAAVSASYAGRIESAARSMVERLAVGLQASLMVRQAPEHVAYPFVATRVAGRGGFAYGTLPPSARTKRIVERVLEINN